MPKKKNKPSLTLPKKWVSIDIGFKGGLAFWENSTLLEVHPMPTYTHRKKTYLDKEALLNLFQTYRVELVVIEDIHAMPSQGVVSMFRFGTQKGFFEGLALGLGIGLEVVSPQKWKKAIGLVGLTKKEAKKRAVELVNEWFGLGLKKTEDGKADAVLIGLAWLRLNGFPSPV